MLNLVHRYLTVDVDDAHRVISRRANGWLPLRRRFVGAIVRGVSSDQVTPCIYVARTGPDLFVLARRHSGEGQVTDIDRE